MKSLYLVFALAAVALLAYAGGPRPAVAQSATPSDLAHQFIEARNRGDVDGALALLAPAATFQGAGQCMQAPCSGDALRAQLVRETGLHIKVTVLNSEVTATSAKLAVHVTNDRIQQCGVQRVVSTETYSVADGKITAIVAAIDPSDAESAKFLTCPPPGAPPAATAPAAPSAGTGLEGRESSQAYWWGGALAVMAALTLGGFALRLRR